MWLSHCMLLPDFPVTKLNWIFHGKCEIDIWCKIPSTWHQAGPRCHTPCAYPAPGVQHQANWHLLCNHCVHTFLSRLHSRYVLQKQCAADKTQTCRIRLLNNICLLKSWSSNTAHLRQAEGGMSEQGDSRMVAKFVETNAMQYKKNGGGRDQN